MTDHFEFDQQRTAGTNRHAEQTACPTCDGHRLIPMEVPGSESAGDPPHEVYGRCPACNPAPVTERQPVNARWKTYDH